MKNLWTKGLVVALVLSLFASVVAGCGGGKETKPAEPEKPKVVEIVFWEQDEAADKIFQPQIDAFMKENPNIKVTRVHYETEALRSNFQTQALGGQGPHVVYGPDDNVGVFSTAGIIQPLDSFFSPEFLGSLAENALDGNRLNGKLWGIPDRIGNHLTLVYNKKLVEKVPGDTDELFAFSKEFSKKNPGKYALVFNQTEPFWLVPWLGGFGGAVFDKKNEPSLNTKAMVDTLTFLADLKKQGVIPKESDYDAAEALFKEGKAAMIINGPWSWQGYIDKGIDIGLARIPMVKATGKWPAPYTSTKSYFVSRIVTDSAVVDAVKKFIEYMNSEKVQTELALIHKQTPTNKKAAQSDAIKNDKIMKDSAVQVAVGTPMPIIPQMRAVWDSMKPQMQLVLSGKADPAAAAKKMQEEAVKKISEMK